MKNNWNHAIYIQYLADARMNSRDMIRGEFLLDISFNVTIILGSINKNLLKRQKPFL